MEYHTAGPRPYDGEPRREVIIFIPIKEAGSAATLLMDIYYYWLSLKRFSILPHRNAKSIGATVITN